jgi:exodeoxyribonuclease VII large subunit
MARDKRTLPFDFTELPRPLPASVPAPSASRAPAPRPPEAPAAPEVVVYTVAELGLGLRGALEGAFGGAPVWVEGEITGARPASSGHLYFTLKDEEEEASVDVVVYRSSLTPRMRALVRDGMKVQVRGKATFWAPRGRVQLVADRLKPAGAGALLVALEELKARLAAEGLFAPEAKRKLPAEPRCIGVVTSAQGAVIHDICKVAFRRGGARILLADAQVQGAGATDSIVRALKLLSRVPEVDVIIIGRGGGSADDLMAFNDELVVRAVAASRVPVVSAIGHEVDVTLTDFAADVRAATPSQAAELVVPDRRQRATQLQEKKARLWRAMQQALAHGRLDLGRVERMLRDPRLVLAAAQQRVDDLDGRLTSAMARQARSRADVAQRLAARLSARHPRVVLAQHRAALTKLDRDLHELGRDLVGGRAPELRELAARLDAMSPLKVLGRGYAIATLPDGRAVRDAAEVEPGDELTVRVARGAVVAVVKGGG